MATAGFLLLQQVQRSHGSYAGRGSPGGPNDDLTKGTVYILSAMALAVVLVFVL